MAEQLSLFDEKNLRRLDFQNSLSEFNLEAAIKHLDKWEHVFNAPDNLDAKRQAIDWLQQQLNVHQRQLVGYLAWLLENLDDLRELEALKPERRFLINGLNKALYDLLPKDSSDFISEKLHPAEIFIQANDYNAALHSLERYFLKYGEHPFLRELQAFLFWNNNKTHAAMVIYTFVLFADPFLLREDYLMPKTFRKKLAYLREKLNDETKARARLSFELWHEGQTYIEGTQPSFEDFIRRQLDQLKTKPQDLIAQTLRFNKLLFLAESERLRSYPNAPGAVFTKLIEEMRQINYEKHALYLETLKSFRNI